MALEDEDELSDLRHRGRAQFPSGVSGMLMLDSRVLERISGLAAKHGVPAQVWVQNALIAYAKEQGVDLLTGKDVERCDPL